MGGMGETIDGSWHEASGASGAARYDTPRDAGGEPAGVIIDQRASETTSDDKDDSL